MGKQKTRTKTNHLTGKPESKASIVNKKFIPLWIMFVIFFFCYITIKIELWVLLSIWTTGLAIYLLMKMKLPSSKGIIISIIFAMLVTISYFGMNMGIHMVLTSGLIAGIPTLLCSLSVFSVIEKMGGMKLISNETKYSPFKSVLFAIMVGIILSVLNYFFMIGSNTVDFEISASRLLVSLSPAIFEEMAHRAIFMAFCIYVINEEKPTTFQQFTMWFMMCFPHTLGHGYDMISTILLCIIFGLPFAFLQKKKDIASAIISHGLVDAIRFTIFGLGIG